MGLRREIGQQPKVAARLLDASDEAVHRLVAAIRRRKAPAYALIAARGTSDHAATYAQYALGSIAGLPVALAAPSLVTRYRTPTRLRGALVLGISQSGRSPDVVGVIEDARRQGQLTAAITNEPSSPLGRAAEFVLPLHAGREASVAATKTFSAELIAIAALATALADRSEHSEALARVPEVMDQSLEYETDAEAAAEAHRAMEEAVILGRGFNLATALEWALKLKELAYVRAQGYSTADFQHGPAASLPPGGSVLAISARGPLQAELTRVLARLSRNRRAEVLRVVAAAGRPARDGIIRFPDVLPEWLSPLAAIAPIQLFCYHLARTKGLDYEAPRGLQKVTLTH